MKKLLNKLLYTLQAEETNDLELKLPVYLYLFIANGFTQLGLQFAKSIAFIRLYFTSSFALSYIFILFIWLYSVLISKSDIF